MTDRHRFSTLAASCIWFAALVGSWTIGLAVLGSLSGELFSCGQSDPAAEAGGIWGWAVLGVVSIVPVLVMVAIAPPSRRIALIGLSVVVTVVGAVLGNLFFGACL